MDNSTISNGKKKSQGGHQQAATRGPKTPPTIGGGSRLASRAKSPNPGSGSKIKSQAPSAKVSPPQAIVSYPNPNQRVSEREDEESVEIDHLKMVIIGLKEKIKALEDSKEELYLVKSQLQKAEQAREELHESISETLDKMKIDATKAQKFEEILTNENAQINKDLRIVNNKCEEELDEISNLKHQVIQLSKEKIELNVLISHMNEIKQESLRIKEEYQSLLIAKKDIQQKYLFAIQNFDTDRLNFEKDRETLSTEYRNILQQKDLELSEKGNELEMLRNSVKSKDMDIRSSNNKLLIFDDVEKERNNLLKQIEEYQISQSNLADQIESLKIEYEEKSKEDEEQFNELMQHYSDKAEEIKRKEQEKLEQDLHIKQLTKDNIENRNKLNALEQLLCHKEDLAAKVDMLNEVIEFSQKSRDKLQNELSTASDYIVKEEDKVFALKNVNKQLQINLEDRENEICNLKDYIIELKSKINAYIPYHDDPVDIRLADFINNYPDRNKLKIMFHRETSGVYLFGSRRIFVKIEMNKIIIKVGGGFLTIQEFLELYAPIELDKMQKADPVKKYAERIAMQNVLAGKSVSPEKLK